MCDEAVRLFNSIRGSEAVQALSIRRSLGSICELVLLTV